MKFFFFFLSILYTCMSVYKKCNFFSFLKTGNILPPENMKKYEHRFIPVPPAPPTPPPMNQKIDSLGQKYVPRSEPLLWKLSYKLNHPSYEKVNEGIKKRRAIEEMVRQNHSDGSPLPQNFPSPIPQHFS